MEHVTLLFTDVFSYQRGRRWKTADHVAGEIPYVSSSGRDNGIAAFVTPPEFMQVHKNKMTLANSGTVGVVFYHPYEFVASDHCMVLSLKDESVVLDEDLFSYLRPIVESIRTRYNFGREITNRRLDREVLQLPSSDGETPDWEFMRRSIRDLRSQVSFREVPGRHTGDVDLREVPWADHRLADFFERIQPGRCGNAQELLTDGSDMPYVGAKRNDYGVVRLVDRPTDERLILPGPCMALICDGQGSVGYSTYVPFDEFVGTTTVKFGYHSELDVEVAAFLTTVLDLNRPRFSFGRKWGARVDDTVISLPTTPDGTPDFQFMRRYIRSVSLGDRLSTVDTSSASN